MRKIISEDYICICSMFCRLNNIYNLDIKSLNNLIRLFKIFHFIFINIIAVIFEYYYIYLDKKGSNIQIRIIINYNKLFIQYNHYLYFY